MGFAGNKHSRDSSLNGSKLEQGAVAMKKAAKTSSGRVPEPGNAAKQSHVPGSTRLTADGKQQAVKVSRSQRQSRAAQRARRNAAEHGSPAGGKVKSSEQAFRTQNGQAADPVMSSGNMTQPVDTPAGTNFSPRGKRNKNKFRPDAEQSLAAEVPEQSSLEGSGQGALPPASNSQQTDASKPSQAAPGASAAADKKRKNKNKFKQEGQVSAAEQNVDMPPHAPKQGAAAPQHAGQQGLPGHQQQEGKGKANNHVQRIKAEPQPVQAHKSSHAGSEQAAAGKQGKRSKQELPSGYGVPPAVATKAAVKTVTAAPMSGTAVSANWAVLKAQIVPAGGRKRQRPTTEPEAAPKAPEPLADTQGVTPVLAVDCEMVGVGPEGKRSTLARVCVVNQAGNVLLDKHVAQKEHVTDYRTRFSGIRPADLVDAPSLEAVQAKVAAIFKGRTVVGHSITNDLTALLLSHPRKAIRDTARYPPLMRASAPGRRPKPRALRHLAAQHLGLTIQAGEHSPVDDARAALYLYLRFQKEWEHHIERGTMSQLLPPLPGQKASGSAKRQRTFEELAAADPMVDL